MIETTLSLDDRKALPDALRVLLEDYPRTGWEQDAGYNGLISFWLERHMMFRKLLAQLETHCEQRLENKIMANVFAKSVARYGSILVSELHGHHTIEDQHYFPVLISRDKRLVTGFELLDSDHHLLDSRLHQFVDQANMLLSQDVARTDEVAEFHKNLSQFSRILDRHLVDEEELVVPVILKYGASGL